MPRDPAAVAAHAEVAGGGKPRRVAGAGGGVWMAAAAPAEAREHPTAGRLVRHAPALAPTHLEVGRSVVIERGAERHVRTDSQPMHLVHRCRPRRGPQGSAPSSAGRGVNRSRPVAPTNTASSISTHAWAANSPAAPRATPSRSRLAWP